MEIDFILKSFKSFLPLILSKDPCEIPRVSIKNKHSSSKLLFLKKEKPEIIIVVTKKIKVW